MRTTITERHTKTLCATDSDISTELARRLKHGECQQVSGNHHQRIFTVSHGHRISVIVNLTAECRVLQQHAETFLCCQISTVVAHHHIDSNRCSSRTHHINGLRVTVLRNKKNLTLAF